MCFFGKGLDRVLISTYERDAIRPHALGKFRDLLEATSASPAMLFYLDNWQNIDPNSLQARKVALRQGKELGINENYAREIMELHTLGVNGGYTQQDVDDARAYPDRLGHRPRSGLGRQGNVHFLSGTA